MSNATQQQASPQQITWQWLRYSKDDYTSVQNGTAPPGSQGGQASARFNWDVDTPRNPFWCYAIAMQFNLTVSLSIPAGGTATISPFAPYSAIGVQLTIGGGQAIQPMSLVPFWLDELTSRRDNDWTQYAPAQVINADSAASTPGVPQAMSFIPEWAWDGSDYGPGPSTNGVLQPLSITDAANNKYYPGQVIPNSGGTTLTTVFTIKFQAWMQLGRKLYGRQLEDLTGCIPMGDPANRPTLYVNVAQLVGTFPEQNLFVSAGSGASIATATTSLTVPTNCQVIWVCKQLDQLPDNVSVGTPKVLSALEVNTNGGFAVPNAGQFVNLIFDTAMVYNKRFHIVVNNQLPVSADYFGIWYSENQSNARFFWDGTLNNLQEYFRRIRRAYGRNLPKGVYVADLVGGEFPEFPRETPYRGEIVTSTTLAGLTGLKPYPNAQTTLRFQAGSSMAQAYVNTYSFGTVPVSY